MKNLRRTVILALGALALLAGNAPEAIGDPAGGSYEVRMAVTPPPAVAAPVATQTAPEQTPAVAAPKPKRVRQVKVDITPKPVPAPPDFSKTVNVPSPVEAAPPAFAEKQLLSQIADPPAPPAFPGWDSTDGAVQMNGTTPVNLGPASALPQGAQAAALAGAEPLAPGQSARSVTGEGEEQWRLAADRIIGEHGSEYLEAVGGANLVRGFNTLKADFIRYYQSSRWVILRGHVRVMWEGDVMEADEAEFDLSSMQGWLKNGKVFVPKSNIRVQTEYARRYGPSNYRFQNAKFTACDGDTPAWSFTADEGDLDLAGRTKLWNAKFNVMNHPVAYSPFLSLPGNGKRQSGLLIPEISSSARRGYTVNQAYFWVLDEERDVTFYENMMSSRGLMQGIEYRHTENTRTKGDWRLDFLNDRRSASQLYEENSNLRSGALSRNNSNRWWLRSKYDGFVADPEWNFKLDLDMVSDQDYLREFNSGASGFESSRKNFLDAFGRDIDVVDSLTRTSTAFLSRSGERFGVAAKASWTENLSYLNGNNSSSKDPTTQTLPELSAFAFKQNLPGTPLDIEATGQMDYFWRRYGTRALRTDAHPVLSLPMPLGPVTLIPTAGMRTTSYLTGGYTNEPTTTTGNKAPTRNVFELGFTGFTEFSRVFTLSEQRLAATPENVGKSEWGAIRHSVEPRLEFAYVPAPQSQIRLPYFDSVDRLTRKNTITYSLTNVFDRRRTSVVAAPDEHGGNSTIPVANTDYLDFLRVRIEESYNRDEAARTEDLEVYHKRPFSDIMLETSVHPDDYINLTSKTYYSPYLHRPTEHEHTLTLTKEKLGELRFGHDYLYPVSEYTRNRTSNVQVLTLGADYYLTDKLKFVSNYRMDIAGHSDLEKSAALVWRDQCYEVQFKYARKPSDQTFELRVNLLDFGTP